jgi:hypothetical protein
MVYALSFVYSVFEMRNHLFKKQSDFDLMLFLSTLGMGLLVYHLNNMNEASLACVIWPFGILLTLLIDMQFRKNESVEPNWLTDKISGSKSKNVLPLNILRNFCLKNLALFFVVYLAVCSIMIQSSQSVKDEERIWDLSDPNSDRPLFNDINDKGDPIFVTVGDQVRGYKSTPSARIDFIKKIAKVEIQEDLLILSQWDSLLYLHANAKAPVSWPNWYIANSDDDFAETYRKLLDGSIRKVVIDEIPGALGRPYKLHAPGLDERLLSIIKTRFTLVQKVALPKTYSSYVPDNWAESSISLYELR